MNNLINNKGILYIYDLRGNAFGIENIGEYLVIVKDKTKITTDLPIHLLNISEWFDLIEKCEILPWICACLNKKYVIKEYVKLMMSVDPLKLRKNYEEVKNTQSISNDEYINLFARLYFTNQILENHKIKNFNISSAYFALNNTNKGKEIFGDIAQKEIHYLKKYTDGILLKDKIKCKQS